MGGHGIVYLAELTVAELIAMRTMYWERLHLDETYSEKVNIIDRELTSRAANTDLK